MTSAGIGRRKIIKSVRTCRTEFPSGMAMPGHFVSVVVVVGGSQFAERGTQDTKDEIKTQMLQTVTTPNTTKFANRQGLWTKMRVYKNRIESLEKARESV